MNADELKRKLSTLGFSLKAFAQRVNANERTVRRWTSGEQEIPGWVGVMLDLMADAQNNGHGEFYGAWEVCADAAQTAFQTWVSKERPRHEDVTIEIELITTRLCELARVDPRDLDFRSS